ncbi:MAG: hypothetical protein AB7N54_06860 [Alphaproteobacteria bacterium]
MLRDTTATTLSAPAAAPGAVQVAPPAGTRGYSFDRFLSEGTPSYGAPAPAPAPLVAEPLAPRATTSFGGFFNERYPLDLRRPQPVALVPASGAQPVQPVQPTVVVEAPAPAVAPPTAVQAPAAPPPVSASIDRTPSPLVEGRKFGPVETPRIASVTPPAPPVAPAQVAATPAAPAPAVAPDGRRLGPARAPDLPLDEGRSGAEQRAAAVPPRPAVPGSDDALAVLMRDFAPPLPPGAGSAGATPAVAPPPAGGIAPPPDTGPTDVPGKLRRPDQAFPTLGRQGGPFEAPGRMSTPVALPAPRR